MRSSREGEAEAAVEATAESPALHQPKAVSRRHSSSPAARQCGSTAAQQHCPPVPTSAWNCVSAASWRTCSAPSSASSASMAAGRAATTTCGAQGELTCLLMRKQAQALPSSWSAQLRPCGGRWEHIRFLTGGTACSTACTRRPCTLHPPCGAAPLPAPPRHSCATQPAGRGCMHACARQLHGRMDRQSIEWQPMLSRRETRSPHPNTAHC